MGLDQYAQGLDKKFYRRKHARLQKFMSKEHSEQNPEEERDDSDLNHLGFNGDSKNPNVNEEYRHNPNNPLYEKLYQCITYKYPQILNYWLTPLQLDREFHISLSLQKQFISSSSMLNLPYQKIGGKFVCYKRDKIIAWLKKNKIQDRQCCIQN